MHILVDCTVASEICQILESLGHEATYAPDLGVDSRFDETTLGIIESYDCLLTTSTFSDPAEWLLIYQAAIDRGLAIVQLRLPKVVSDPALDALRCMVPKMEEWIIAAFEGYPLTIVSRGGADVQTKTKDDVADMIRQRSDTDKVYR